LVAIGIFECCECWWRFMNRTVLPGRTYRYHVPEALANSRITVKSTTMIIFDRWAHDSGRDSCVCWGKTERRSWKKNVCRLQNEVEAIGYIYNGSMNTMESLAGQSDMNVFMHECFNGQKFRLKLWKIPFDTNSRYIRNVYIICCRSNSDTMTSTPLKEWLQVQVDVPRIAPTSPHVAFSRNWLRHEKFRR
jgi:hypothetical protein